MVMSVQDMSTTPHRHCQSITCFSIASGLFPDMLAAKEQFGHRVVVGCVMFDMRFTKSL